MESDCGLILNVALNWNQMTDPVKIKDTQTPLPSEMVRFLWKMRNMLNRMKIEVKIFCDFYFSSYGWFIYYGRVIFLSIQPIADLSCKFNHFKKYMFLMHVSLWVKVLAPKVLAPFVSIIVSVHLLTLRLSMPFCQSYVCTLLHASCLCFLV